MSKKSPTSKNYITIVMVVISLLIFLTLGYREYLNKINAIQDRKSISTNEIPKYELNPAKNIDIQSWKKYDSPEMGFTMRLPPRWFTHKPEGNSLNEGVGANISYPVDNASSQDFIKNQEANIEISIYPNHGKTALEDIKKRIRDLQIHVPGYQSDNYDPALKSIIIDNEIGYIDFYRDHNGEEIIINHDKYTYRISLGTDPSTFKEFIPIFDTMLTTIKFTQPRLVDK